MGSREEVCGEDVNFNGDIDWNKAMQELMEKQRRFGAIQELNELRRNGFANSTEIETYIRMRKAKIKE